MYMYCPLVPMALKPHEDIGAEAHKRDQLFRVEEGADHAVHRTRAEAEADIEHFDGKTTE